MECHIYPALWGWHMTVAEFLSKTRLPYLYHFTDVENLESIARHGLLSYRDLTQRKIGVPKPGGNDWSHEQDVAKELDRYVHLCLTDQHPMEYVARQNGHIGETRFLHIHTDILRMAGVAGCAGVANRSGAEVLPLEAALEVIDLDVLFVLPRNFSDPKFRERYNEARKAEILIPGHIATNLIVNLNGS